MLQNYIIFIHNFIKMCREHKKLNTILFMQFIFLFNIKNNENYDFLGTTVQHVLTC